MKKLPAALFAVAALALAPVASQAEDEALFTSQSLTPETALKAATAALAKCRADGYQISVAIVDRSGLLQVMLRDRYAGAHTLDTARRKAWTATSFRADTSEIVQFVVDNPQQQGLLEISGAMMIGGGMIIDAGGSLVGAIGVSGGPNPSVDDVCAAAGIEAIEIDIQF